MMYPITLLVLVARFLREEEHLTLQREATIHQSKIPRDEAMPRTDGCHPESPRAGQCHAGELFSLVGAGLASPGDPT